MRSLERTSDVWGPVGRRIDSEALERWVAELGVERRLLVAVVGAHAPTRRAYAEALAAAFDRVLRAEGPQGVSTQVLLVRSRPTTLDAMASSVRAVTGDWRLLPRDPTQGRGYDVTYPEHPIIEPALEIYRARRSGRWGAIVAELACDASSPSAASLDIADEVIVVVDEGSARETISRVSGTVRRRDHLWALGPGAMDGFTPALLAAAPHAEPANDGRRLERMALA